MFSTTDGYSLDVFVVDGWEVKVFFDHIASDFVPTCCMCSVFIVFTLYMLKDISGICICSQNVWRVSKWNIQEDVYDRCIFGSCFLNLYLLKEIRLNELSNSDNSLELRKPKFLHSFGIQEWTFALAPTKLKVLLLNSRCINAYDESCFERKVSLCYWKAAQNSHATILRIWSLDVH